MADRPDQTLASTPAPDTAGADEDWTGRMVGEFHILRSIGKGGMGHVYLAEQTSLKRKVAIKMLRPDLAANRTALARFKSEAEAVAKLNHPNIVQIYGVNDKEPPYYMALEYVEGKNLRDYLNRKGPPELGISLHIMRQVAAALHKAHGAGFIHRDVKPENILLTRKGEAKVTDFGLTRGLGEEGQQLSLTQTGVAMGTPLYMSPEQVQGKPVDQRSDIYSFGVTCFSLFAGSTPFRGQSAFDVAVQHVQNEPPALAAIRPDLPPEICAMIHKMMAKNPDERYQSFKEILRDINSLRDTLAGGAPPVISLPASGTMSAPSGKYTPGFSHAMTEPLEILRRRKWFAPVVIAAAVLGLLAGGVTARVIRHKLAAKETTPAPAPTVTEKPAPAISEEESYLRQGARRHADPNPSDERKLKDGLEAQIELTLYLFQNHRIGDVDDFARELLERKYKPMPKGGEHPYRAFARLAQALVMAFRDQTQAVEQLGKLIQLKFPNFAPAPQNQVIGGVAGVPFFDNPELQRLITEALVRLAIDLKVDKLDKYPQLEALRKRGVRPKKT
jgi:tRNA A-37 threonylcarbamoyl transferase component Bud32